MLAHQVVLERARDPHQIHTIVLVEPLVLDRDERLPDVFR